MTDKMTIQEAITELNECYLVQSDSDGRRRNKAVTMAIEALEKQIPMKADGVYCNKCGWQVKKFHKVSGQYSGVADGYAYREEKHDYCESCGQAIDWESDTE